MSKVTQKGDAPEPDAHLERLIEQAKQITRSWAERHELWIDSESTFKDPLQHFQDEPGEGDPILLLCSDGPVMSSLYWDDENACELRDDLEKVGLYLEFEDAVTACYHLIDYESDLQKEFDRYAQWKWMCRLIEADSHDVTGSVYQYFVENPQEFHRLHHRDFEKLVSSIFAAHGWRTELGPGVGDGGVDLRVWQTDPLGDLLTLVQIKRYAAHRPIEIDAVAALETHVNRENANRGLFVTSSRYFPGVQRFAERGKHRLQLADSTDISRWCEGAAFKVRAERNKALAIESFSRLVDEVRLAGAHPRLLVGGRLTPSFCVVLKETRTSALLIDVPSRRVSGDMWRGEIVPHLDLGVKPAPNTSDVFRAKRSEDSNGRVSYWGDRTLFFRWNGKPFRFDHWD